jgi:hypothetical protein
LGTVPTFTRPEPGLAGAFLTEGARCPVFLPVVFLGIGKYLL